VTAGSNGAQADADHTATALPVNARKGYDTVSGLGAPLWPSLAPYVFSPKAPAAQATISLADPHVRKKAANVLVRWHPANPGVGALLASSASVTITHVGASAPVYSSKTAATTGSYRFAGIAGGTYVVNVTEYDAAGKHAAAVRQVLAVPYDDTTFRLTGSWRTVSGSTDYAGSHIETSAKNATATATARGTTYELLVRTGPTYGKLAIFQGGKHIGTYDLFSSAPAHTTIPFFGGARTPAKARTFTFKCTGVPGTFSSGATVALDGLAVTR
jgi:hypothetical protein